MVETTVARAREDTHEMLVARDLQSNLKRA